MFRLRSPSSATERVRISGPRTRRHLPGHFLSSGSSSTNSGVKQSRARFFVEGPSVSSTAAPAPAVRAFRQHRAHGPVPQGPDQGAQLQCCATRFPRPATSTRSRNSWSDKAADARPSQKGLLRCYGPDHWSRRRCNCGVWRASALPLPRRHAAAHRDAPWRDRPRAGAGDADAHIWPVKLKRHEVDVTSDNVSSN